MDVIKERSWSIKCFLRRQFFVLRHHINAILTIHQAESKYIFIQKTIELATLPSLGLLLLLDGLGQVLAVELYAAPARRSLTLRLGTSVQPVVLKAQERCFGNLENLPGKGWICGNTLWVYQSWFIRWRGMTADFLFVENSIITLVLLIF